MAVGERVRDHQGVSQNGWRLFHAGCDPNLAILEGAAPFMDRQGLRGTGLPLFGKA